MKWNRLEDDHTCSYRHIWVTNGVSVWIAQHSGSLWKCSDKSTLRWAEIEKPEVPKIETEQEELLRLRELEKSYFALIAEGKI